MNLKIGSVRHWLIRYPISPTDRLIISLSLINGDLVGSIDASDVERGWRGLFEFSIVSEPELSSRGTLCACGWLFSVRSRFDYVAVASCDGCLPAVRLTKYFVVLRISCEEGPFTNWPASVRQPAGPWMGDVCARGESRWLAEWINWHAIGRRNRRICKWAQTRTPDTHTHTHTRTHMAIAKLLWLTKSILTVLRAGWCLPVVLRALWVKR